MKMQNLAGSFLNRYISFGSREHKARIRGFNIGEELLHEAGDLGVTVQLNAVVAGLYDEKRLQ